MLPSSVRAMLQGGRVIKNRSFYQRMAIAPSFVQASGIGSASRRDAGRLKCAASNRLPSARASMGLDRDLIRPCSSSMSSRAAASVAEQDDGSGVGRGHFPSLLITAEGITAQGSFAETQATFMTPDPSAVRELDASLSSKNMGVVAHYYMDAELQGTLSALRWEHVAIADSLAMGDAAARMAQNGVKSIVCLGVDFMAESVRATLDANGHHSVPVYRLSEGSIGCSLAEAAERKNYEAWLRKASNTPSSMHVVYINTSLMTKALSQSVVPTITCTSSNVLYTVLQAFAQVPGLTIWYGPDTYMGENLHKMLSALTEMSDEEIKAVHPRHDRASVRDLLPRFHYFLQGNCIVHHMFGEEVVERVRSEHADAFHTAHLEVPGEMFRLAMEAQNKGRGVVGSTSNILGFIKDQTRKAVDRGRGNRHQGSESEGAEAEPSSAEAGRYEKLSFVLGTESGMITSIVRAVQQELKGQPARTQIEIVFPVASEAITATGEGENDGNMSVVPGVSGGEGCSTAGGCATCPFMKMNDLDALMDVARAADETGAVPGELSGFLPKRRVFTLNGEDQTQLGVVPILHMRHLMANRSLSEELVSDVKTRCG